MTWLPDPASLQRKAPSGLLLGGFLPAFFEALYKFGYGIDKASADILPLNLA